MIRDVMDILEPHFGATAEGTYYPARGQKVGGSKFRYEFIDPRSRTYRRIFGNLQDFESDTVTISTPDRIGFRIGGLILLNDGASYTILECQTDYSAVSKQALRMFSLPLGTRFLLRLQSVEEPWGVS